MERELVQDALRRHGGKITSAALELGISRPTLYELMEKLGNRSGVNRGPPPSVGNLYDFDHPQSLTTTDLTANTFPYIDLQS